MLVFGLSGVPLLAVLRRCSYEVRYCSLCGEPYSSPWYRSLLYPLCSLQSSREASAVEDSSMRPLPTSPMEPETAAGSSCTNCSTCRNAMRLDNAEALSESTIVRGAAHASFLPRHRSPSNPAAADGERYPLPVSQGAPASSDEQITYTHMNLAHLGHYTSCMVQAMWHTITHTHTHLSLYTHLYIHIRLCV